MAVRWARKISYAKENPLRGFTDMGTSPGSEFVYLKDAFEYGAHSQLFVGMQNDERRVFKRVSALASHTPSGLRHTIAQEKAALAISLGRPPSKIPWQEQGTMPRRAIAEEIAAICACKSPFARTTVILATGRDGVSEPSKYFYVMPPAPTDLLGCIHALETQKSAMRRNVALMALMQLGQQLYDMHVAQGKAHRDVRSENILCNVGPNGSTEVLLWDFGLSVTGDYQSIEPWARQDMHRLGKVFAMLLAPDLRASLDDENLPQSLNVIATRFADLTPILHGVLDPRPELRWTGEQLLRHLEAWPPATDPEADVRAFMPSVHPLMDAIDAKWEALMEALDDAEMHSDFEASDEY